MLYVEFLQCIRYSVQIQWWMYSETLQLCNWHLSKSRIICETFAMTVFWYLIFSSIINGSIVSNVHSRQSWKCNIYGCSILFTTNLFLYFKITGESRKKSSYESYIMTQLTFNRQQGLLLVTFWIDYCRVELNFSCLIDRLNSEKF